MRKIQETIKNELEYYKSSFARITSGYSQSTYKIINRTVLYLNGQYNSGNEDSLGRRKWFFSLYEHRAQNVDKNLDVDLSNIKLISVSGEKEELAWLAKSILYKFLKQRKMSVLLNKLVQLFSRMGNVVAKKTNDDRIFEIVDPRYLYVIDQTVEEMKDSTIIQKHYLSEAELREQAVNWNLVDSKLQTIIKEGISIEQGKDEIGNNNSNNQEQKPYYKVIERYGLISEDNFKKNGKKDKRIMSLAIVVLGEKQSFTVHLSKWTGDLPYKEVHYSAYKGVWWRAGLIQQLFELQERYNEINNQIARQLELSKILFQGENIDETLNNLSTDIVDGEIINGSLNRLDTTSPQLNAWIEERSYIESLADNIANSYEILTGEKLPSNMPFRLGALSNQNANKYFDFLREELTIFLEDILNDWVLPKLVKMLNKPQRVKLLDDPDYLEFYYRTISENRVNELEKQKIEKEGIGFTDEERANALEQQRTTLQKGDKTIKLKKNMFKGLDLAFEVIISDESRNIKTEMETGTNLLQLLSQNRNIVQDSLLLNILNKTLTAGGFSPIQPENRQIAPQPNLLQLNGQRPNQTRKAVIQG